MRLLMAGVAALAAMLAAGQGGVGDAFAGDCTGSIVGVRPISQYNHATGAGFLAVRSGPGGSYRQIGELYAGDAVSVWDRRGNWYAVTCMSGRCLRPLWGNPSPSGWAHRNYIRARGVCP